MFRCPNKTIANKRDKLLIALRERGLNIGFPRPVMEALSKLLYDYINRNQGTIPQHPDIAQATGAQIDIGVSLLPRGYVAKEWITVLK